MTIVTQRSQLEAWEKCPRSAYWNYYWNNRGVERKALSVPLATGLALHQPLGEILWLASRHPQETLSPITIEEIVRQAKTRYLETVISRGLLLDYFDGSEADIGKVTTDNTAWQVNEQLSLLEALVHGWARVRLPRLLAEYEVLDVEQEQQVDLGDGVVLLTRRDALLKRKQTKEGFVHNFKSASVADKTWMEQWRFDMQTMSEFVAAQASCPDMTIRGVLIEGLIKGPRNLVWPKEAEPVQRRHNSPLVYHYMEPANPPFPEAYAAGPYRRCGEPHPWRWAKGGFCPGGKNHKLPDSYQLNMVSQTIGIKRWLDWLEEHEPQVLEAQFVSLPAILRSEYEIERWQKQTTMEAKWMDEAARLLEEEKEPIEHVFPMHTGHGNCVRPSRCPYAEICWGVGDPHDPELYLPRTYNHPQEEELRK